MAWVGALTGAPEHDNLQRRSPISLPSRVVGSGGFYVFMMSNSCIKKPMLQVEKEVNIEYSEWAMFASHRRSP